MIKAKALSTFRTKLSHDTKAVLVNFGDIIEAPHEHIMALSRNRLVQVMEAKEKKEVARKETKKPTKKGSKKK